MCQVCRCKTSCKQHYNVNKQSQHPSSKRADTTLLTNNIMTKINNPIVERAENKQSHHPSVERADTTLLTNNIMTKINNPIIRVSSAQKINNPIIRVSSVQKINNPIIRVSSVQIQNFFQTTL